MIRQVCTKYIKNEHDSSIFGVRGRNLVAKAPDHVSMAQLVRSMLGRGGNHNELAVVAHVRGDQVSPSLPGVPSPTRPRLPSLPGPRLVPHEHERKYHDVTVVISRGTACRTVNAAKRMTLGKCARASAIRSPSATSGTGWPRLSRVQADASAAHLAVRAAEPVAAGELAG